MIEESQFQENLRRVTDEIARACKECNRDNKEVKLLPVTKNWPSGVVQYCKNADIFSVGENRVQEALQKQSEVEGVKWELIGHLQSNKIKQVVGRFDRIQTVDSDNLLSKLQSFSERSNLICKVLLQVNAGNDPAKYGCTLENAEPLLEFALECSNLQVDGLMTIAPYSPDDPTLASACFRNLRELRDRLSEKFEVNLTELSMGMSGDLTQAIESGSTMIRVGTALFGNR